MPTSITRLSVYPLVVPPLRERGDDVLLLAGYFIRAKSQRRLGLNGARLSRRARQWPTHYDWPGNVRELRAYAVARHDPLALAAAPSRERVQSELGIQHLGTEVSPLSCRTRSWRSRKRRTGPCGRWVEIIDLNTHGRKDRSRPPQATTETETSAAAARLIQASIAAIFTRSCLRKFNLG